ncbi:MAG: AMP-binding protein, partial [Acidobacteria bacterium]|nr:AMP-binding protein [Acidobacteriota bacterium]
PRADASPDDTAEIIFTSGATSEPKGVILTHRNILANVIPIEHEIAKYRRWARPFHPIRFLDLLPLSHMFGQALATFIPPLLPGVVVFTRSYSPGDIIRQIRTRRVSVLVCVPKILEVLRDDLLRNAPEAAQPPPSGSRWWARWWRYRRVHRLFGYKFWAIVVGGAPLDPDLEAFWQRLGFVVIQGYGLTETAPIVTLNHPLNAARGAVGTPIAGVEVRIAADGEILVRGDNVSRGYFNAPDETRDALEDGWFHTGDVGALDDRGRLYIRGRKKEMIVTPEGLNVFPDDVERALNDQPGVRDSAVVGAPIPGSTAERVHAVLVADPDVDIERVIRGANERLQDHQKIRAAVVWPGTDLPRTEGTRKLKRRELKQWLTAGTSVAAAPTPEMPRSVAGLLERFAPGRTITSETAIDELGLSSLERVELMMAIEDAFQVTVDEARFAAATTVGALDQLIEPLDRETGVARSVAVEEAMSFPRWNRRLLARAVRRISLPTWILPGLRGVVTLDVSGTEHLTTLHTPVIFAANHQSHLDTLAVLAALPALWRYRVAPTVRKEFFEAHFHPEGAPRRGRIAASTAYYLATLFLNVFPLPQREAGTRETLRYAGELIGAGYSVLIYPEGVRTYEGEIARFQSGVGMMASRLDVPVVPVRIEGLDRVLHRTWRVPRRGRARIAFGRPISFRTSDYAEIAARIESAVREL